MKSLLFIISLLFATAVNADEKRYGSFIFNETIPNTLFFMADIERTDSFELRKALRNHDIQNIVLASPGGSVWEGLQMAGIIFDKKLRTYIPPETTCASACAFLFFAGHERQADGKLGVHQTNSPDGSKEQKVGTTQFATQFTVSEIIGFLNEFGTPSFVYEKMFQDIEVYYFDDLEIAKLNSQSFSLDANIKDKINSYIRGKSTQQPKEERKKLSSKELITLIQKRLKEIGCEPGPADGIWGQRTQAAANLFAKKAGLPTSKEKLISEDFIERLASVPSGYCPKPEKPKWIAPKKLTGTWSVNTQCPNGEKFYGSANINLINVEGDIDHYRVTYINNLNQTFSGNGYTIKGRDYFSVELRDARGRVQDLMFFRSNSNLYRASDVNNCKITVSRG